MTAIVVDTNVFVHSCNPENNFFDSSVALVERIQASTCLVCVDEGLSADEARNNSRIWSEYMLYLPNGSLAKELLAELLISNRIIDIATKVPQQIRNKINQRVTDNTDRIFVKVSFNADCESLVSHDYVAFPDHVRMDFRKYEIANIVNCEGNVGI